MYLWTSQMCNHIVQQQHQWRCIVIIILIILSKKWEMKSRIKTSTVIDLVLVITTKHWIISFEKKKSFSWFSKGCWRLRRRGIRLHSGQFAAAATDLVQKQSQRYLPVNRKYHLLLWKKKKESGGACLRATSNTASPSYRFCNKPLTCGFCSSCRNNIGNLEALLEFWIPEAVINSFIDTANFSIAISANNLCRRAVVLEW